MKAEAAKAQGKLVNWFASARFGDARDAKIEAAKKAALKKGL